MRGKVPRRKRPDAFTAFNDLDAFLFHMSIGRAERAKMNLGRLHRLGEWLDREWSNWVKALPKPYAGLVDSSPVCQPLELENGVTRSTACTEFTATKLSLNHNRS
jgi:hypothetical protein